MEGEDAPTWHGHLPHAPALTQLGQAIVRLRRARDLSDTDLAGLTAIPVDRLRDIESGAHDLGFVDLCVIAAALEVGPDDLVVEARREG